MIELIVIDTDILIDVSRGIEYAIEYLGERDESAQLAISSITEMELIVGCQNKDELQKLEKFLSRFLVIHVNRDVSALAVNLLKKYRLSHGLLIADALIASIVIINDGVLASKNQKDYRFIEALNLLPY